MPQALAASKYGSRRILFKRDSIKVAPASFKKLPTFVPSRFNPSQPSHSATPISHIIKISEATFTAIDFESAGTAKGRTDAPVQIGLGSWTLEQDIHEPVVSFLQCDQDITWSAQKVHGITTDDLLDAPSLLSLWPTLKKQLGRGPIVAHGHGTEKRFQPSHSLGDLCTSLDIGEFCNHAPDRSWHDALYDALASLALLKHLVSEFNLADQPVAILLKPDTTTWHRLRHS